MLVCGIDVSAKFLDVAIGENGPVFRVEYTRLGLSELAQRLSVFDLKHVIIEASGGYERKVCLALFERGFPVALINPARARDLANALGQFAKTDAIDARVLAMFGAKVSVRAWRPPSADRERLTELSRRRDQLVEDKVREGNRRKLASEENRSSIEFMIAHLKSEIARYEGLIQDALKQEGVKVQAARLQSMPGIGVLISAVLLAEFPELGSIDSRQASALVGVAPFAKESGGYRGKRQSRGGRPKLRKALYMGALVAVKHNPVLKAHYEQLVNRGKAKKVALIACINKMVGWLNAMEKHEITWTEMRVSKT